MKKYFFLFFYVFIFSQISVAQKLNTDSLKLLIVEGKPDTQRVSAAYFLFRDYFKKGKTDSALNVNKLILTLYKKTNNPKFYGYYMNDLGNVQHGTGSYDSAIYYYEISLKYRQMAGDESGIAQSYNNMGNSWTNKGDQTKALMCHEKSLEIKKKINDKKGIAQSLYNIGNLKYTVGLNKDALENYLEALKIGETINYTELLMNAYGAIGNIYNQSKDYEKARVNFEKALSLARKYEDLKLIAINLSNLGNYYYHIHDTARSAKFIKESMAIDMKINNRYGIAMAYNSLGTFESDNKNFEKSLGYYQLAKEYAEAIGHLETQCLIYINMCAVYLKQENYKKAYETSATGLAMAEKHDNLKAMAEFHRVNALAQRGLKNYKEAYEEFVLWGNMNDSLIQLNNAGELSTLQMKSEYEKEKAVQKTEDEKNKAIAFEEAKKERVIKYSLVGIVVFVLIITLLVFRNLKQKSKDNLIIRSQKQEVELQKTMVEEKSAMLEEKNKEITDSINYAKKIQYALLAHNELLKKHLKEHFVYFKPKDIVSGDFYWGCAINGPEKVREYESPKSESPKSVSTGSETFFLAVCDSTGHGVPGAFMSLLNISFLNEAINEKNITDPAKVFDHVRNKLIENISQEGQQDGMDGILMCFNSAGIETGITNITYAAANNPPVIIQQQKLSELPYDKMPVGKGENIVPFNSHKVQLSKKESIYLFTDGFADQFGGPKGKKFKYKALSNLLLTVSSETVKYQKEILSKTFDEWKNDLEQIDDVLVIGIRN